MNETDSFRARLSFRFILLERKWNASWFVAAFVCYTHVYLLFAGAFYSSGELVSIETMRS